MDVLRIFTLSVLLTFPLAAADKEEDYSHLPREYREWLENVDLLITQEELDYFLTLEEDFRRNAFIKAFWKERDEFPDTPMVELQVHWDERTTEVRSRWGRLDDARSQAFLVQGEPFSSCLHRSKEIEIWIYDEGRPDAVIKDRDNLVPILFYKQFRDEPYRRWSRYDLSFLPVSRPRIPDVPLIEMCDDSDVAFAQARSREPTTDYTLDVPQPSKEWVPSFASQTTDLPDGAELFDAELALEFPGRHQQRSVAQGIVSVAQDAAATFGTGDETHSHFLLLGELVIRDEIFEAFRYRFELPVPQSPGEPLALVFQRYLRPGRFRLILKLEDLYGNRFARLDQEIEVPNVEHEADVARPRLADSEIFRYLAEANAATARGERAIKLLSPGGVVQTGLVRFKTVTVGEFDRVDFLLDDQVILSKRRPAYSVELDLGDLPEMHRLRANGYDATGQIAATDELILNPGGQRFRVHLTEPQSGRVYRRSLRAAVQVIAPGEEKVERVEIFLGEDRVATLYQAPYTQPILLAGDDLTYVRAVAYLEDGNSNEDLVYVNAPGGNVDEVHVHFVELFATVRDKQDRLVSGLTVDHFKVLEDGVAQEARRFEWVDDLPLHTALLIDTSASMQDSLEKVGEAALAFVEQTIEPQDRASVISFSHLPNMEARFTNDTELLSRQLKALRALGGTSLYDSLVFALHYFSGVKGQKALLILSDGKDESSDFDFESALEFARRAGVMIYTIALKESDLESRSKKVLRSFATETGGRAFFVRDLAELDGIYASIQSELRSQYLFAYQSSNDKDPSEFRRVEIVVEVDGKRLEVQTMSGYYP